MNKAEQLFMVKALKRGGQYLYPKEIAFELVKECEKEKIRLLGIDGFLITDKSIQPNMSYSVDFSSSLFEVNVYNKAIDLLEESPDNLFFEIICE